MVTTAPSSRASLLAGLRTGGVRSSGPVPHTAAPTGTFNPNVPRFIPASHRESIFPPEDDDDELSDMVPQNLFIKEHVNRMQQPPMTAAVDGGANRFSQQQTMGNAGTAPFSPFVPGLAQSQMQALQLQIMQLEINRLQAIQAQQYQLAQAQAQVEAQRQYQSQQVRRSSGYAPPATAGPANTSFDLRAAAMNAQLRRANQAEQLRAKLGVHESEPMTAALGGKFGSRVSSGKYDADEDDRFKQNANYTTVISGGTPLGSPAVNGSFSANVTPSKSDTAVSWRRGGNNNSVLSGNRAVSSPLVKITPPPAERVSPPPGLTSALKNRPRPLHFSSAVSQPLVATVAVDSEYAGDVDDNSSVSSKSNSSPTTPRSASSSDVPLSPREEASKKLYEGLGIGRPVPVTVVLPQSVPVASRVVSQPMRQPRGPPSNNDELVPKNFASRSRRKAVDALMEAVRERREVVEGY